MSSTNAARSIGKSLMTIAAVAAAGVALLMLVPGLLGLDRYVITGGSMSGTFERGTLVLAEEVPVADLEVGDIITYLPPAESGITALVTHRIVSIEEDAAAGRVFRTQGDANPTVDPWTFTLAAPVQARVEGWVPLIGWIFIGLSEPGVRMIAIGIPAALVGLLYLRDFVRALRVDGARRHPAPATH